MTEQEAIERLKDHFEVHNDGRPTPYLDEAVSMAIDALEKRAINGWIKCEDRLPTITVENRFSDDVITALKWYDGDITYSVGWYNKKSGSWNEDCENRKVIAWQPLPEPFTD